MTAEYYCKILEKLRRAIQNKRRGKLTKGVLLLHDNARPHVAATTKDLLALKLKWEILSHPPYSPDLAPSDYHLFPYLKTELGGVHFESTEDVKRAVHTFSTQSKSFYARGIKKLVTRYQNCLDLAGDYVEK